MAEPISITITNLPQIRSAFARAPFQMAKELNFAIQKTIFSIGRQSRINTPVLTGRLRASTYESFGNLRGEVGTNTTYDIYVHNGTRYMAARPYLKQAVDSNSIEIKEFFLSAVNTVLKSIGDLT